MNKLVWFLFLLGFNSMWGQVKVGDNIDTIDSASIMELESTTKVLVVTRMSSAEMNAITPLNGALAYNIDQQCLFQYRDDMWNSLCVDVIGGQTVTTLTDNLDGTITYSNESNTATIISKSNLSNNGDGTFTFTNGGSNIILDTNASALPYNNASSGLLATNLQDALDELKASSNVDGVTITGTGTSADPFKVENSAIINSKLANDAITSVKILDAEVKTSDLENDAITADKINVDVAGNGLTQNASGALEVDIPTLTGDGSLITPQNTIQISGTATNALLDDVEIDVADNAIDNSKIANNAIRTENILNSSILNEDIADFEISASKLRGGLPNEVLQTDVVGNAEWELIKAENIDAKDLTPTDASIIINNGTGTTILDTDIQVATDGITNIKMADNSINTAELIDNAITSTKILNETILSEDILDGTIADVDLNKSNIPLSGFGAAVANVDLGANQLVNVADPSLSQDAATKNYVDGEVTTERLRALAAEAVIQADVDTNEADADAAIALKEDAANKSTDVTLADGTNTKFPTELAVKTYVDGQIAATADDDITAVSLNGASLLTIDEGTTSISADLSALEESADIAAVQADVDTNEADADAAIAAVQADVDTNEADADAALAAVQSDVDTNEADADAAIAAVQADVDTNEADTDATIAALQADVDTNEADADAAIAAVQADVDTNEADADAAIAAVQADVDANEADADAAIAANTAAITAEESRALAAEAAIQADVDTNEADADAAIALKEDSANKSTDVTLADGTNTKFPTELAVKTYVDGQIAATADDDITAVSLDGASLLTIDEGTTSISANLSALEESADIAAVQADVDANEADADAAIALKEDAANKSTDVTLADGTNTKFPTELAVKTYVDGQIAATADDDITAVSLSGASLLTIDEGTTSISADLSALEESADIAAVQADVDANEADADAAIAANTAAITAEETRALAAEAAIQADVDANEADADAAITAVQADVDINEADADTAIALKEDSANKSTDVTLADGTNTKFPTELAVKTYVDGQIAATADDDITAVTLSGTSLLTIDEGATSISADLSALEESADIAAVQVDVDTNEADADAAIAAIQADVDSNEADADAAIAAVQADVDANEADADAAIATVQSDVDANEADADAAIATVQSDVDANEADADAAIAANTTAITAEETRALAAEAAIQADVDTNEADADAAIAAVQSDVDTNEADADAAIAVVQADVDANEVDADAAIALKEDSANKSADVTLADGTNTKFPTELAVKTYVDGQIAATADDDITAVSLNGASLLTIDEGTTSISADLSALEESADIAAVQADVDTNEADADAAIAAVQADVDTNEADADAAIAANSTAITAEETRALAAEAAIQADVDQNEADADAAIALKEDTANKSSDVTLADGTNTKFPTELAVKTYVDGQIAATADDDITAVSLDGASLLTIVEGATSISADLSALEESADITALQADVDQNEADADAAIALKEDSANKSADVTLADGTNTKFPTELAVKTYVDGRIAATADDDITAVTLSGTSLLTIDEGATSISADLSALEESADIAAVQADVDTNEVDADAAIAAVQADVDTNEADADSAIAAVQTDVDTNEADADAAIAAVQVDVDANEVDADAAIALKEDAANKSTDVTLADGTNTKFPTELAVKTYVDGQITATADDDITAVSLSGASLLTIDEGTTSISADLSALEESADISAVQADVDTNEADADTAIAAVQADVDANEADADAAISTVQSDVDANEADADTAIALVQTNLNTHTTADQDLSATNEIQTLSISGSDLTISGTGGNTVTLPSNSETTTTLAQNTSTGLITYTNEASAAQTANVVGAETDNSISAGANGGAYYSSPIKAFGKISSAGTVVRATTGVTITKLAGNGHYRVNLPTTAVSDVNYIIQLTQPGRGGAGNDDPGISYSNQTATSFEVIIGDNDNGGTDRSRFNSEFMFTVIDL